MQMVESSARPMVVMPGSRRSSAPGTATLSRDALLVRGGGGTINAPGPGCWGSTGVVSGGGAGFRRPRINKKSTMPAASAASSATMPIMDITVMSRPPAGTSGGVGVGVGDATSGGAIVGLTAGVAVEVHATVDVGELVGIGDAEGDDVGVVVGVLDGEAVGVADGVGVRVGEAVAVGVSGVACATATTTSALEIGC